MKYSVAIDTTSAIDGVRLTIIDGPFTTLNSNATVGNCYVAELTAGAGVAIFAEGAAIPAAYAGEPNIQAIPAAGLPTGNYKIDTTDDGGPGYWDAQDSASDFVLVGDDLPDLFSKIADIINNLTSTDTDKPLSAAQGKILKDNQTNHYDGTSNKHDADDVNITDTDGNFTATEVESALAEIGQYFKGVTGLSAANIQTIAGITGTPMTVEQGYFKLGISYVTDKTFTFADAGSGRNWLPGASTLTGTLPAIDVSHGGSPFLFTLSSVSGGKVYIVPNSADDGFVDNAGNTGNRIELNATGESVLVQCDGLVGGRWYITGGYGYTLATV